MKEDILYRRTNKNGISIFLKAVPGHRNYPEYIKKHDRIILIGIEQNGTELTTAYSYDDQVEMWKAVYEIQVMLDQKAKIISILENLLRSLYHKTKRRALNDKTEE